MSFGPARRRKRKERSLRASTGDKGQAALQGRMGATSGRGCKRHRGDAQHAEMKPTQGFKHGGNEKTVETVRSKKQVTYSCCVCSNSQHFQYVRSRTRRPQHQTSRPISQITDQLQIPPRQQPAKISKAAERKNEAKNAAAAAKRARIAAKAAAEQQVSSIAPSAATVDPIVGSQNEEILRASDDVAAGPTETQTLREYPSSSSSRTGVNAATPETAAPKSDSLHALTSGKSSSVSSPLKSTPREAVDPVLQHLQTLGKSTMDSKPSKKAKPEPTDPMLKHLESLGKATTESREPDTGGSRRAGRRKQGDHMQRALNAMGTGTGTGSSGKRPSFGF